MHTSDSPNISRPPNLSTLRAAAAEAAHQEGTGARRIVELALQLRRVRVFPPRPAAGARVRVAHACDTERAARRPAGHRSCARRALQHGWRRNLVANQSAQEPGAPRTRHIPTAGVRPEDREIGRRPRAERRLGTRNGLPSLDSSHCPTGIFVETVLTTQTMFLCSALLLGAVSKLAAAIRPPRISRRCRRISRNRRPSDW